MLRTPRVHRPSAGTRPVLPLVLFALLSACGPGGEAREHGQAARALAQQEGQVAPSLTQAMLDATPASLGATLEVRDGRVTVEEVLPGGPAEQGGVRPGDVVLRVEGAPVERPEDFARRVEEYGFDNRVLVDVERDGRSRMLRVPLEVPLDAPTARALPLALPTGAYRCLHLYHDLLDKNLRSDPVGTLNILPGDRYRWFEGDAGRFTYDAGTGVVDWQGGAWGARDAASKLAWTEDGQTLLLRIVFTIDGDDDLTYRCYPPR